MTLATKLSDLSDLNLEILAEARRDARGMRFTKSETLEHLIEVGEEEGMFDAHHSEDIVAEFLAGKK